MELKSIFQMTKTDRYTQDGRDELAKLQETEDVKYKTGDISQKTGLQKQPDGSWAPPKKGSAERSEFDVEGREADRKEQKKAAVKAKRDEALKQERREGENRADDFRKKVESGEIVYNNETGKFEEGSKPSADWKETPSGRTNMIRTPEGTATVTWNKEANGEEWYGFSTVKNNKMKSSDTHYKTKAEAQLAAENELKGEKSLQMAKEELAKRSKPTGTGTPAQKSPKEIIATPGKLATQEQTDAATAIADKNSYSFETMMEKFPIQKIQQFANSKVDDFEGGIDEYIEFKAEGRTGVDMEEVGKDFAKLINHNVARRIWNGYTNGSLKVDEKGFFKPAASIDSAPRILTGDTKIRIKK